MEVVELAPLTANVLLVEPWVPAHAPVASEYQPAPVLGGAGGKSPLAPVMPLLIISLTAGMLPTVAKCTALSGRIPSAANISAFAERREAASSP